MERSDYLKLDKAKRLMSEYQTWKEERQNEPGWFAIYSEFVDSRILKNISGNALRLYIYLGIRSKNMTGESWHSIGNVADYFGKSERTIAKWVEELKKVGLVERIQPTINTSSVTFLKPYNAEAESYTDARRKPDRKVTSQKQ